MDYTKLLSNTIQSISVELRTETSQLATFSGTSKVILTLQFKKFGESNGIILYQSSICIALFSGHYRQRGSGFGALASGIGRIALPLARKFIIPAAKRVGKELLLQSVPELMDVVN